MVTKQLVHARIGHLYSLPGFVRPNISSIRACDMGKFVQVSGTVVRTGMVRMVERRRFYVCTNSRCRYQFPVAIEIEHDNTMQLPRVCPNPALPNGKRFEALFVCTHVWDCYDACCRADVSARALNQ
jgi:DNA helicase MCM9